MTAYAYIRVSTERQQESTRGIRGYIEEAIRYAKAFDLDLGEPVEIPAGDTPIESRRNILLEEAVSASKTKLTGRPMGRWLAENIRPGDTIIFPRLSRGFRNALDCISTVDVWESIGIKTIFLDSPVQGRAMLALLAIFAEWESEAKADRARSSHRASRLMGRPQKRQPDPGFRWKGTGRDRRMVPCPRSLAIMATIQARRAEGKSYEAIALEFIKNRIHKETYGKGNPEFDHKSVLRWYNAKKRIDEVEQQTGVKIANCDSQWLEAYNELVARKAEEKAAKKKERAQQRAWREYQKTVGAK